MPNILFKGCVDGIDHFLKINFNERSEIEKCHT
jgi:hypothetical protein